MMAVDWEKVEQKKVETLLEEINPHIEPVPFNNETTTIRTKDLKFYSDLKFLELTDLSAVPSVRKYALYKKGDVNVVNWTNQTIYDTNEKNDLILNEKTVTDYVRFFFNYVRGRHGRFLIIEAVDDIKWQSEPPPQGRKVIQEMIQPIVVTSHDSDGTYNLDAFMIFKDSLFKAIVHVQKDGVVSLSDEELKIEGMPIIPDASNI